MLARLLLGADGPHSQGNGKRRGNALATVEENLKVGEMVGGPGRRKFQKQVYGYFPILEERRRQRAGR